MAPGPIFAEPSLDCQLCPRLAGFRQRNEARHPGYHNAPVRAFGGLDARLLIVGLAPGLHGANRSGRPFTGDYAGDLLYATLLKFGLASGRYGREADDGLKLLDCRITNAVRCLPPENKPTGPETRACRDFLAAEIAAMPRLSTVLALGALAHGAILGALGVKRSTAPFGHGAKAALTRPDGRPLALHSSYHCSRYNTNTGRLTEPMFEDVFRRARALVDG